MRIDRQVRRLQLAGVATTQSGHFTAAQALSVGYSYQAQKFHADRGNWQRLERGLFRLPEWPVGEHDDLVRTALWSRHRAVASHETALAVHDLGDVNPTIVHLTVPPSFRARPPIGVRLHRADLPTGDVESREGFSVTTPIRTLLDAAAGTLDLDQLADILQVACERVPATKVLVMSRAEELGPRSALRIERALRVAALL